MSSKFKIEYHHKFPQSTSPYLQLMEAKKKIFGYKYEVICHQKPSTNHNKSISASTTQPPIKYSKTQSNQKQKPKSQKQNSRKKRSHTEAAQQRMHESLFLNRQPERFQSKQSKHQATKSLFAVDGIHDQSINPHQFLKQYKNQFEPQEKNMKMYSQQIQNKQLSKEKNKENILNPLEKLEIHEIDDLLHLIDSCIEQSNDYIGYLTEKIQALKTDMDTAREEQSKILKIKDGIINQKEQQVHKLKRQLYNIQYSKPENQKSFQIKKLLEIIEKLSEENVTLKQKIKQCETNDFKHYKQYLEREKKDLYHQIHNKIDILNISIDKKPGQFSQNQQGPGRQSKKSKFKPKFYK